MRKPQHQLAGGAPGASCRVQNCTCCNSAWHQLSGIQQKLLHVSSSMQRHLYNCTVTIPLPPQPAPAKCFSGLHSRLPQRASCICRNQGGLGHLKGAHHPRSPRNHAELRPKQSQKCACSYFHREDDKQFPTGLPGAGARKTTHLGLVTTKSNLKTNYPRPIPESRDQILRPT